VKHKKQKHSIITPSTARNRRNSTTHRASFPGPGYNGVPEGWNWQDPRNARVIKQAPDESESSDSGSDSDHEAANRDASERREAAADDLMNLTSEFKRVAVAEDVCALTPGITDVANVNRSRHYQSEASRNTIRIIQCKSTQDLSSSLLTVSDYFKNYFLTM